MHCLLSPAPTPARHAFRLAASADSALAMQLDPGAQQDSGQEVGGHAQHAGDVAAPAAASPLRLPSGGRSAAGAAVGHAGDVDGVEAELTRAASRLDEDYLNMVLELNQAMLGGEGMAETGEAYSKALLSPSRSGAGLGVEGSRSSSGWGPCPSPARMGRSGELDSES
jgi:hypothetical protein